MRFGLKAEPRAYCRLSALLVVLATFLLCLLVTCKPAALEKLAIVMTDEGESPIVLVDGSATVAAAHDLIGEGLKLDATLGNYRVTGIEKCPYYGTPCVPFKKLEGVDFKDLNWTLLDTWSGGSLTVIASDGGKTVQIILGVPFDKKSQKERFHKKANLHNVDIYLGSATDPRRLECDHCQIKIGYHKY